VGSGDRNLLDRIVQRQNGRLNWYRVDTVNCVVGQRPTDLDQGWGMVRIENNGPIGTGEEARFTSPTVAFRGMTQQLHYTSETQRRELDARSHQEFEPSNDTVAVLIPIGKSQEWWRLAQDGRQAHFQNRLEHEGHIAIGARFVDRVFRKLYHSRRVKPLTPYDFLTYFEFSRAHKADFKMLLAELRDVSRNPEWNYVTLEYEIWMTKIG